MKNIMFIGLTLATFSYAKDKKLAELLSFQDARIFVPSKGSVATAGYAVVNNKSEKEVSLVISKAEPFKAVETHMTVEKEGRMAMEKVDKFLIPANGSLELKPGGNHIMLFEPSREIKVNEEIKVEFLVDGQNQEVPFKTIPRVSTPKKEETHHH
ncbi:MAG: copper chaperone PCu(A)C [Bdellovibrionaceae bacterium]|nr:copper chaperone PCu(A)C [Pseudobdellovibrionaceae bacterium]NUM59908.1 copper chaperone PCu(A)C [Pseudobdellovibrionaceae bacterium]